MRHARVCAWCFEHVPKNLVWTNRFAILAMFLVPAIVLLAPVPIPIVIMAQHSVAIGWFAAMYMALAWIILGSFKAAIMRKIVASIPLSQASSSTAPSPASTRVAAITTPFTGSNEFPTRQEQPALSPAEQASSRTADQASVIGSSPLDDTGNHPDQENGIAGPQGARDPVQAGNTTISEVQAPPADSLVQAGSAITDAATPAPAHSEIIDLAPQEDARPEIPNVNEADHGEPALLSSIHPEPDQSGQSSAPKPESDTPVHDLEQELLSNIIEKDSLREDAVVMNAGETKEGDQQGMEVINAGSSSRVDAPQGPVSSQDFAHDGLRERVQEAPTTDVPESIDASRTIEAAKQEAVDPDSIKDIAGLEKNDVADESRGEHLDKFALDDAIIQNEATTDPTLLLDLKLPEDLPQDDRLMARAARTTNATVKCPNCMNVFSSQGIKAICPICFFSWTIG